MSARSILSFFGPGYLVAVGYLDPGNWATDLSAGSEFGYHLLFIVLIANMMAVLLQYLCIKLGTVCQRDLAEACRENFPWRVNLFLYLLCEIAIIACDLAEIIGSAIALELLFGIPLIWGILVTCVDVLIVLSGWTARHNKKFELGIVFLVFTVGFCFSFILIQSKPDWMLVMEGFVPKSLILTDLKALYVSMGIIGATVMPHNLYLHSNIVKIKSVDCQRLSSVTEDEEQSLIEQDQQENDLSNVDINRMIKYSNFDCVLALTFAFAINSFILIVSASALNDADRPVGDLSEAYNLLSEKLGAAAGIAFAFALLLSGQSSTVTGTMAGQICMEGFLGPSFKIAPWLRRLITRSLAILPAVFVAIYKGKEGINDLLVLSQVILSLQLPLAVWPLVMFTSNSSLMTTSEDSMDFSNTKWTKFLAYITASIITLFNMILVIQIAYSILY